MALIRPSSTVGHQYSALNRPAKPTRSRLAPGSGAAGGVSESSTPVFSESARASSTRPRASSHAGDSGILKKASGSRVTSGRAPIQNIPRHPIPASRMIASRAAIRLPSGTPQ